MRTRPARSRISWTSRVASSGQESVVDQWAIHRFDPASGRAIQPPIPSGGPVPRLVVTPDGRYLVGAVAGLHPDDRGGERDADRTRKWRTASLVVWEAGTGRVVRAAGAEFEADVSFAGLHQLLQPMGGAPPILQRRFP